jgi:DNA repair protein RecO (recombination protein O)
VKYQKFSGIIINRRAVSDNDRFLTIYTEELGKISVYAKGIRSMKSKRGNSLDLFSHIKFEVFEKNDRRTLTSIELLNGHADSKTELKHISRLFQIGELVDRLTAEEEPGSEIYKLLVTALTHLSRFDTPKYMERFKKKLLSHLGYGTRDLGSIALDDYIESLLDRPLRTKLAL